MSFDKYLNSNEIYKIMDSIYVIINQSYFKYVINVFLKKRIFLWVECPYPTIYNVKL